MQDGMINNSIQDNRVVFRITHLLKCSTPQCSTLVVLYANFDMASVVPNRSLPISFFEGILLLLLFYQQIAGKW